ncbi:phosphoribosylaminoimidazole carboxylase ade2 [Mycoemilia scoparia]|uniref:phosphoribosylaminoimidazole carboxylase n=1 Tax=Mycoemilia scoparia TaxID=417184 RepID=A0A9W8DX15_9FUNG|nr:phosphoribosylaminoimidazole carboxylase ade2 [Mycoemilia scoparia]
MKVPAALMVNLLSPETYKLTKKYLVISGTTAHLYGKEEADPGRKMGRITIVVDSFSQLQSRGDMLADFKTIKSRSFVGIIVGPESYLPTMKSATVILEKLGVLFELTIVSTHRTPLGLVEYAKSAHNHGLKVIIAGADGAAHLPVVVAAMSPLSDIGVPAKGRCLNGVDSLYSIFQISCVVPVAVVAINNPDNAAPLATRILGSFIPTYLDAMTNHMEDMGKGVKIKIKKQGWKEYSITKWLVTLIR